ncbi:AraC family transcriptional regulator [Veronia nyctiphanis]|uniref:AraC family transcriptional regulator n=1 Tax=Veronia nyctiphanis TaxID=1278244 RepID=A0A4Q0YN01_9GAMM|nr:DJ-1/PfpI family protein [Veronia nyctiphanis]RXJ72280.1 AraC family transcriptional regulator [Veronia nyctiphanis]
MDIAILTFDGFNELDSFIALGILSRMQDSGWNVQIACPSQSVISKNGVIIQAQQPLEFANSADVVLFGISSQTRHILQNSNMLSRLILNTEKQLIGGQCSGVLLMYALGLLNQVPVCTDLATKPWARESGIKVLDQPFYVAGNIATTSGCLSSTYLAAWVISKLAGKPQAESAIHYVAPVGEEENAVKHCLSVVSAYL